MSDEAPGPIFAEMRRYEDEECHTEMDFLGRAGRLGSYGSECGHWATVSMSSDWAMKTPTCGFESCGATDATQAQHRWRAGLDTRQRSGRINGGSPAPMMAGYEGPLGLGTRTALVLVGGHGARTALGKPVQGSTIARDECFLLRTSPPLDLTFALDRFRFSAMNLLVHQADGYSSGCPACPSALVVGEHTLHQIRSGADVIASICAAKHISEVLIGQAESLPAESPSTPLRSAQGIRLAYSEKELHPTRVPGLP